MIEFRDLQPKIYEVGKLGHILKFCLTKELVNRYWEEFMLLKLSMIRNIINVGNDTTENFPILFNFQVKKNKKKFLKKYRYGQKKSVPNN